MTQKVSLNLDVFIFSVSSFPKSFFFCLISSRFHSSQEKYLHGFIEVKSRVINIHETLGPITYAKGWACCQKGAQLSVSSRRGNLQQRQELKASERKTIE
jgi:hypothetical protein